MDLCVEDIISGCLICQSVRSNPPAAPLHPWPWATRIWQRAHIDFAETGEHNYLIVVDSHSKWLEVIPMKTITSEKTIDVLRTYSHLMEIVSDNGPQFVFHVFKIILKSKWY